MKKLNFEAREYNGQNMFVAHTTANLKSLAGIESLITKDNMKPFLMGTADIMDNQGNLLLPKQSVKVTEKVIDRVRPLVGGECTVRLTAIPKELSKDGNSRLYMEVVLFGENNRTSYEDLMEIIGLDLTKITATAVAAPVEGAVPNP